MIPCLLILGLPLITALLLWYNLARLRRMSPRRKWVAALAASSLLAASAGVATSFISYHVNDTTVFVGWPIPTTVFQQNDQGVWLDYVGPTIVFGYLMNASILTMLLNAPVAGLLTLLRLRKPAAHRPGSRRLNIPPRMHHERPTGTDHRPGHLPRQRAARRKGHVLPRSKTHREWPRREARRLRELR